jgi:thiosulfate/3-mercaptopyruvate sulfurtransferase
LLNYFGFEQVAVLNGGFNHWLEAGNPVDNKQVEYHSNSNSIVLKPNPQMMVTTEDMSRIFNSPEYLVIDARIYDRYIGKTEPIDKKAGHIPGAINRFHGSNLSYKGTLKSPEKLRMEFLNLFGNHPYPKVIVYCGSGVTSCHHILAMKSAGIQGPRLYLGSWSEWIQDPDRPIATL